MFCFKTKNQFKQTINKSKFFCLPFNISNSNQAKEIIKELRSKYIDASHICYAYIFGNNQESYFYSDDGEPNKTAGFPIFKTMQKYKLSFSMIVIVRYFGGIKLGVSQLKNSFASLAEKTIKNNDLIYVENVSLFLIEFDYNDIKKNENKFKNTIVKKCFKEKVTFEIYLTPENKNKLYELNPKLITKNYLIFDKKLS